MESMEPGDGQGALLMQEVPVVQRNGWAEGSRIRDTRHLFIGRGCEASEGSADEPALAALHEKVEEASKLVSLLRHTATRLLVIEGAIDELAALHERRVPSGALIAAELNESRSLAGKEPVASIKAQLGQIEAKLHPAMSSAMLNEQLAILYQIKEEVNSRVARLEFRFRSLVQFSVGCDGAVAMLIERIGHHDFQAEGRMYVERSTKLAQAMQPERWGDPQFDVLSAEASQAISLMTWIGEQRLQAERLVADDSRRHSKTLLLVTLYIFSAAVLFIVTLVVINTPVSGGPHPLSKQVALTDSRVAPLYIPWQVLVWSLVGSFAAMIHRLNHSPIYDFGDAFKWMITRPVQGVVLGAATYLILVAGLFMLTGGEVDTESVTGVLEDEVVLLVVFLVGFSDRFADSVLNTLVRRYAPTEEVVSTVTEKSEGRTVG